MTKNYKSDGTFMAFDVESIGLHGDSFAVGWVIIRDGKEVSSGHCWTNPDNVRGSTSDRKWVAKHVPGLDPALRLESPRAIREMFWAHWMNWRERGAVLVADCHWPVEARFLCACIDDDRITRSWQGPYPFIDVGSVLLAAGLDPLMTGDRLPNELPAHHPLADARQSARVFLTTLKALEAIR
jgi:hypothetical protein